MADFSRYLPLVGIVLFFALGIVWRAWLQHRRHGHAGLILFRSGRWTQHLLELLFVVLLFAAPIQAIVFAASPGSVSAVCFLPPPAGGVWLAAGVLLLFGGTGFTVAAQLRLGASWRIGIDEAASPGLVTAGLYQVCRNPIFLGMFITLAGMAVLIPTGISVIILVGTVVAIRYQVMEEEAYLTSTYGDAYRRYAGRVGRFVPGVGRLRRA